MYGEVIADNLLFLHAFSGCDTTSAAYNIGKMKFLATLETRPELASGTALFLNERVDPTLLTAVGERFFISLYGGNKDDSLDSLRYKRFAKSVTKNTFNLSSLPPTQDTARLHSLRVYHQVQSWLGNYNDPQDWVWKKYGQILMPIQSSKPPAPPELLKLIFCRCKGNCGAMCGCRKAGLKCSAVCLNCSGETCSNIMEISKLIEENDFEDELPTMTPLHSPSFLNNSISEAQPDPESQPGTSKRLRTQ
uniref:Tesmin/TSO1-like CXC domain-containing protein n=1 Tax=Anoplophora glabripennis TaxID=217634 RepID=V5I848_ANOGL